MVFKEWLKANKGLLIICGLLVAGIIYKTAFGDFKTNADLTSVVTCAFFLLVFSIYLFSEYLKLLIIHEKKMAIIEFLINNDTKCKDCGHSSIVERDGINPHTGDTMRVNCLFCRIKAEVIYNNPICEMYIIRD